MKRLGVVAVIALLAGPAYAQSQAPVPGYREEDKEKSQTQKEADKEAQRAYQRSLGSIPEQKNNDPWGTVRSDNAPKAAAKPPAAKSSDAKSSAAKSPAVKPKAKTDSAAKQ